MAARASIQARYDVSVTVSLLPLALYTLGVGFGPLLAAPLSETFGRYYIYIISTPVFALFTLGAGFSQTLAQLIICRFFAGLFGSPGLALAAGTVADVWAPKERTTPLAVVVAVAFLGPAAGYVIVASWPRLGFHVY